MSQQRWGHDVYQDGYQDTRRTLPSRGNQAGSFSPAAKETSMSGDECDAVKCRSRRPPSGRHRAADLPVRSPMDRPKDDEVQAVKAATTPKQRPRSKPKRPDVAIYVPRGRRQQEHANVHASPSEQIAEPKQEKPAKKSAVSSARHTGAFSVPRMRRPQTEKIENQESARVSSIRTDVPPEGDTSQATLIVTGEDSLGDVVKHKTKRKKGSGKTPDEKTGRDTVKKDGKKKRKDGLEQVAPPGEVETKDSGGSEKEIHSLHSHDASVSRSSEYTDTSLLVESGDISCSKTIEDQVESHDALQMVDIDQLQDSVIRCDDHAKTMATELSGQSNAAEKQDKLDQPLGDADQLPGNQENDESHDLAGSCIEAAIPTKQLGEGTDVAGSCSEQLESKTIDKSSVIDEDVCRNVGTKSQGQTAASENEGKDRCEECVPVEDMMVEQCANSNTTCTKRANNNTKELSLDVECNTEPDSQCQSGGDNVSQNFEATMTNKNVVDATSELQLSVCSEETSQDMPQTTDSLTATITDSSCDVTCGGDTSENRDTGDVLVTRDHECCTGDVEAGNSHGRRVDEESENMEERLECEHENKMKENETDSNNELAGNKISEQTANEICKSECEKSEQSVCDNKSESKMDVRDDIGVHGETDNNINSGNNVGEDENESVIHNIKSGKDEANESCQLKPSADASSDTGPAQPQTDITSKTKKVKVEKVKAANSDIGKSPDSASDSHQGHSIAMETEEEDDSWDKLFDDTGEALDPKLVDELTVAVGKVKVQKPQFDYFSFLPKELEMDDDEYSHLVEIYDFPSDLTTTDLVVAFHEYKDQGFDIKWVDDSHAIGIFSSSIAARGALTMSSPFMKVRPISQATRATKLKAKQCTEFLQPYKERPETNASVARSLVAGALGLATRVPKEQREAERRRLREARAKKKQAKQQVVDVWEGRVGGCAMDEV